MQFVSRSDVKFALPIFKYNLERAYRVRQHALAERAGIICADQLDDHLKL
jgi:hypothetical protein